MTFAAWLSVATICILGAMTPGPSLAVVLRYSVGQSRQAGFACALAHGLGIGFYAVITMTGLGLLFQTVPAFRNIVSVLGALYLIFLAIKAWRAAGALFFLALFSQFVSPEFEWGGKFVLAFTAAGIDAAWYCLVAIGLSHGAVLPWLRDHSMWIERIIAVLFVVIAMRVLFGILPI